jgi:hypothetical protein
VSVVSVDRMTVSGDDVTFYVGDDYVSVQLRPVVGRFYTTSTAGNRSDHVTALTTPHRSLGEAFAYAAEWLAGPRGVRS